MKKAVALVLSVMFVLALLSCGALAEGPRFVTIQEWLDAKGECGDCMLLVKIYEAVNPVLAVVIDETGRVNAYSGGPDSITLEFMNEKDGILEGWWMVIANPKYNIYEGTVEMADWQLLRLVPYV